MVFARHPPVARNWTQEEVRRARRKGHEAITKTFPDSVFVKTHNAFTVDRFGPLITLELTAGAIYIVRNPLDVVIPTATIWEKRSIGPLVF
jgi:hypothetical protein